MSDLRWSDCDEQVVDNPIAALLCRTSKLNDHAHATDVRLHRIEGRVYWFGVLTTGLGVVGTVISLVRAVTGH